MDRKVRMDLSPWSAIAKMKILVGNIRIVEGAIYSYFIIETHFEKYVDIRSILKNSTK